MKTPLIVLTGPTAVGKTKLSVMLAKDIGAEIISADSMQVYKNMDIGSAKITPEEMSGVKHYLIDEYAFDYPFNVVEFKKAAKSVMNSILSAGKIPLVVGGTGFYIQALLRDIDFTETDSNEQYRSHLTRLAAENGNEYLHNILKERDPAAAKAIHPNNIKRVIRALEFNRNTGEMISSHNESERAKTSPYNFAYFVLTKPRQVLYADIDRRVDMMMSAGLFDEVKRLKEMGAKADMISMQGLGYKELLGHLDGEYTLDRAVEMIKLNTRHFAKRQMTWFRREDDVIYLDAYENSADELLIKIKTVLREKNINNDKIK